MVPKQRKKKKNAYVCAHARVCTHACVCMYITFHQTSSHTKKSDKAVWKIYFALNTCLLSFLLFTFLHFIFYLV